MIDLAPGLKLPDSAVTNSYALLGMKGSGKSNAAVVFAEELFAASVPWVCVDPKGDWWGIRSSANGRGRGLAVPIFGGLHADVPIDPGTGAMFADLVVDRHLTCIIDVSEQTKAESIRFLTAFFDRLYRRKNRATYPMHLILEECDDYVPQTVRGEIAHLVRNVELCVKRGRQRGLGITLATQRSASVNKDVLTQTDTLIALRTTGPQDRKAIKAWLDYHAGAQEIIDELPTLAAGEAWVSSPAQLRILKRVKFRRRKTFDSGATPELGEKVKAATLADIDVAAITAAVADVIERAEADDPKKLRAEIARLTRERDQAQRARVDEPERVEVEVRIPFVPDEVTDALRESIAGLDAMIERMGTDRAVIARALQQAQELKVLGPPVARKLQREAAPAAPSAKPPTRPRAETVPADPDVTLGKRERAILSVLANHDRVSHRKLALLTGYSPKASTIGAGLSTLRKAGLVAGLTITDAGRALVGDADALPTGPALLEYWHGQLGKRERLILGVMVEIYPSTITHDELAERCGYSTEASTIGAGMSALRGLGIVDGWRLSDEFAEAIA